MSFLVSDGVFPSNEGRGYVLRRIIRRAVRHAYLLDVDDLVTPELVDTTVEIMGEAYPDLVKNHDFVRNVVAREEERFRQTLKQGTAILDAELDELRPRAAPVGLDRLPAARHPRLPARAHPEIALERGIDVDEAGFAAEMAEQKRRAKDGPRSSGAGERRPRGLPGARRAVRAHRVHRPRRVRDQGARAGAWSASRRRRCRSCSTASPFYAESGGQVGDTGTITTDTGRAEVLDTVYGRARRCTATGRASSRARSSAGQEALAAIDVERRDAIRRNHTATHLLHWALREVLGEHVKQQGSLVGARPAALRLQPLRGGHARRARPASRTWPTTTSSPTRRSATTRPPRTTPSSSAPSPSSATSTATSSGCSRPGRTPPSCAAAPTCGPPATSAR